MPAATTWTMLGSVPRYKSNRSSADCMLVEYEISLCHSRELNAFSGAWISAETVHVAERLRGNKGWRRSSKATFHRQLSSDRFDCNDEKLQSFNLWHVFVFLISSLTCMRRSVQLFAPLQPSLSTGWMSWDWLASCFLTVAAESGGAAEALVWMEQNGPRTQFCLEHDELIWRDRFPLHPKPSPLGKKFSSVVCFMNLPEIAHISQPLSHKQITMEKQMKRRRILLISDRTLNSRLAWLQMFRWQIFLIFYGIYNCVAS